MGPKNIGAAVKDLREAMGKSQMQVAVELKAGISTVQRYEKGETVDLHTATKFVGWAKEAGRSDLVEAFRAAIIEYLGPDVIALIGEKTNDGSTTKEATTQGQGDKRKLSA